MPTLQIRPARSTDSAAACEVIRRSISELCEADHGNDLPFIANWLANKTPENVSAWIANPDNFVFVAESAGKIAGVAAMTRTAVVTLNYVSPDAQFKGVSKALLARLEQTAAELGLAQCALESTKTAQRFYRSAGYRETQSTDSGWGISMIKDIVMPGGATTR